jgi:hypothetical protein
MSKWSMRGHFHYLRFKNFPMTPRTPQCEVFWALLSNSKHLGVLEDSKSPTLGVLGFTPTLGQSGVATLVQSMVTEFDLKPIFFATIFPIVCCKDCMDLGFHTHTNELYSKITNYVLEIWVFQICCNSLPLYRNMPL